jgi:nucleoid DNA-binding protein
MIMNLTQIIEETGKRVRLGKRHTEKMSNVQIKEVLDVALAVLQEGLVREGRIEIQGFAVIEVVMVSVKAGGQLKPFGGATSQKVRSAIRRRWLFRPAQALRRAARSKMTSDFQLPPPSSST